MELNLNTFTETNSSIYLIDENLCLKDSVDILNHNFKNWQDQIDLISDKIENSFAYVRYLIEDSAQWATFLSMMDTFKDVLPNAFKVVKDMQNWQKPISLNYPVLLPIEEWSTTAKKNYFYDTIIVWLNDNLNDSQLTYGQIIKINFLFQQTKDFRVHYEATYLENCIASPLNQITCDNGPGLYVGCNHYGGLAGEANTCTNAYEPTGPQTHFCTSEYIAVAPSNNCWSTDPFILTTEYSYYGTEVITSKQVVVEFILKEGEGWALH